MGTADRITIKLYGGWIKTKGEGSIIRGLCKSTCIHDS